MNNLHRAVFVGFLLLAGCLSAAQGKVPGSDVGNFPEAARIQAILRQPESKMDLAKIKLTIDKIIDPTVDIDAGMKQIDGIVA